MLSRWSFSRDSAGQREWQDIFKVLKGKNLQPRLFYLARISSKIYGKIKSFSDKQKLREYNTNKPGLQQMLKGLKDDAVKVLHSICQQIWKTQLWPQDWKISVLVPIPKKVSENKVKLLSRVRLFATSWTVARQASLFMRFSRQEYWIGLPFPSPGDLPDPGIEPRSPALQGVSLPTELPGKPTKCIYTWINEFHYEQS